MKRGITMTWRYDHQDKTMLQIVKKRGKLTLEEIQDLIRYENHQQFCGHYVIFLNCSEETLGGNGMYLEESKGDAVDLYEIEQEGTCPICGKYIPPFEYCPNCGMAWKDMDEGRDVEKTLAEKRREAENVIKSSSPYMTRDSRLSSYWTYIGWVDMAAHLELISENRHDQLYEEAKELRKLAHEL